MGSYYYCGVSSSALLPSEEEDREYCNEYWIQSSNGFDELDETAETYELHKAISVQKALDKLQVSYLS